MKTLSVGMMSWESAGCAAGGGSSQDGGKVFGDLSSSKCASK